MDPQAGAPEHDDHGVEAMAVASTRSLAHDRHDLIDRGRVGGVAPALVGGLYRCALRAWSPASGVGRQRPAAAEKTTWLPPLRAGNGYPPQLYRPRAVAVQVSSSEPGALLLVLSSDEIGDCGGCCLRMGSTRAVLVAAREADARIGRTACSVSDECGREAPSSRTEIMLTERGAPVRSARARSIQLFEPFDRGPDMGEVSRYRRLHGRLGAVGGKRAQQVETALGHPRRDVRLSQPPPL